MHESSNLPPLEWIRRIMLRLHAIYGNRAKQMWGDIAEQELLNTWREYLGGFTGDDIRRAIDTCARAYTEFPPTLPQFVSMCRDARNARAQSAIRIAPPTPLCDMALAQAAELAARMSANRKQVDCRSWARKIIDESKRGAQYPIISIQYANEALSDSDADNVARSALALSTVPVVGNETRQASDAYSLVPA